MVHGAIVTGCLAACLASAAAFAPAARLPPGGLRHARSSSTQLKMQLSSPKKPIDIFKDMNGEGQDVLTSPFLKESEVKHGRLAMLAAVGWPAAELLHPTLAKLAGLPNLLTETGGVPSVPTGGLDNLLMVPGVFFLVMFTIGRAWLVETDSLRPRNNFVSQDPKEQFPHDLGFDPLGFYNKIPRARTAETYNGRIAMLAIALYPLIEFSSKHPVVQIISADQ